MLVIKYKLLPRSAIAKRERQAERPAHSRNLNKLKKMLYDRAIAIGVSEYDKRYIPVAWDEPHAKA